MRNLAARLGKSVFAKIFAVFMVIILLIYFFSVYLYNLGGNRLRKEMIRQSDANIHFFMDNLEKEFSRIISMEAEILFDKNLRILSSDSNYSDTEIYYSINALNEKVSALLKTSSYIDEASVYLLDRNLKVSNLINREISHEEWEKLKDVSFLQGFPFVRYKNDFYINFHSSYYQQDLADPVALRYVISVRLDDKKLKEDLVRLSEGGDAALISLGKGLNILTREDIEPLLVKKIESIQSRDKLPYTSVLSDGFRKIYFTAEKSEWLNTIVFVSSTEEDMFLPLKNYSYWLVALTFLMALIVLIFVFWIRHIITTPLRKLMEAMKRGLAGDMREVHVQYNQNDEFGYIYNQFNQMVENHTKLVDQIYQQKILIKDAQLKQLQYQINPHFLYNSFFILYRMSEAGEYGEMSKMLVHLSNYYKVVTKSNSFFVSLSEEFEHCEYYLAIQSIRFSGRIQVVWEPDPRPLYDIKVPSLILQPIFENCYKHGLKNKECDGVIRCRIVERENLEIDVEDNGDELTDDRLAAMNKETGLDSLAELSGLMNVNQRLKMAFGLEYGLVFSRSGLGGLCVKVRIPQSGKEDGVV